MLQISLPLSSIRPLNGERFRFSFRPLLSYGLPVSVFDLVIVSAVHRQA